MPNNKKRSNRRGKGSSSFTSVQNLGGTSDRTRVRLKYTMQSALTSITTTGAFSYQFRGNSPFDPDFTSTGGQPANYDDWSSLYLRYRCHASTISVHVLTSNSGTEPTSWVFAPRTVSTALTLGSFFDAASMPYAKTRLLSIYRTGASDSVFKGSMTTRKMLGLSKVEYDGRDDLTAAVTTNPALQWFWHITGINVDSAVTSEVAILVEITYDVEFFTRIETTIDLRLNNLMSMRLAFEQANISKPSSKGRASGLVMSDSARKLFQLWKEANREGKDDFQLINH